MIKEGDSEEQPSAKAMRFTRLNLAAKLCNTPQSIHYTVPDGY